MRLLVLASALIFAFVNMGCSRAGKTSQVTLNFGSLNGSLDSSTTPQVIIVNISGNGGAPAFWQWQAPHDCTATFTVPTQSGLLTIPKGDGYLVQVLVVQGPAGCNNGGGNDFLYGELANQSFQEDNPPPVAVTVTEMGGALSAGNNNIAGRFLNADGLTGPTGRVTAYITAPGKHKMLVDQSQEMVGGWFRFFAVQGVLMDYVLENGTDVFGGDLAIDGTPILGANASSVLRVSVPPYYNSQNGGTRSSQSGSMSVFGWFGPGAASKPICYYNGVESVNYGYVASTGSTTISWDGTAGATASETRILAGGLPTATRVSNLCTDGVAGDVPFVNYLALNDLQITSGDSVLGFRGPFLMQASGTQSGLLQSNISGTTLTLNWTYLPGTQNADGIVGADVFARDSQQSDSNTQDYRDNNDNADCANLVAKYHFTQLSGTGVGAAATPPNSNVSVSVDLSSQAHLLTDVQSGQATIAVCPYRTGKKYLTEAALMQPCNNCGNMGGGSATSFMIAPAVYPGQTAPAIVPISANACTPFQIVGQNNGSVAALPLNETFTLTQDAAMLHFYSDAACSTAAPSTLTITGSGFGNTLYVFSSDTNPSITHSFTMTADSQLANQTQTVQLITTPTTPTGTQTLVIKAPTSIYPNTCYPVVFESWNYDAGNSAHTAIYHYGSYTPSIPYVSQLMFFPNDSCQNSPLSPSYQLFAGANGQAHEGLSFKYSGAGTTISFAPNPSPGVIAPANAATNITVTPPGPVAGLQIGTMMGLNVGSFMPVQITLVDANGIPTPATGSTVVTLTATSGAFYSFCSSYPCGGSAITSVTLSPGQSNTMIYYMTGTSTGSVTLAASSGGFSTNQTINLSPAVANQILVRYPGQVFTAGTGIQGTPVNHFVGDTFSVDLYAVEYDFTLDGGYNVTTNGIVSQGSPMTIVTSPVTFAGGHASITVTVTGDGQAHVGGTSSGVGSNPSISVNAAGGPTVLALASQFSVYMLSANALNPGVCQILMVVPEDTFGMAAMTASVNVTFTVSGGGSIYSGPDCSSGGPVLNFNTTGAGPWLFYFSSPSTGPGTISTSAGGFNAVNFGYNVNSGGGVGAAYESQLVGRYGVGVNSVIGRCNPYLAVLTDSNGFFVSPGVDYTALGLSVIGISGAPNMGFFSTPDCSSSMVPNSNSVSLGSANAVIPASPGYLMIYAQPTNLSGYQEQLETFGFTSTPQLNGHVYTLGTQ